MKLTKARLKEIILEEINEMYVTDFAGSAEDRAIDRHRARKRARGQYPSRPSGGYEDPRSQEEKDAARLEAIVQATKNILNMDPNMSLMVDQNTYDAVANMAPELLDRISVSGSRRRKG
tara:strand:+ start:3224 stop:3580 length:357 start_codon:yes stop_codon:yes gene_type:complete